MHHIDLCTVCIHITCISLVCLSYTFLQWDMYDLSNACIFLRVSIISILYLCDFMGTYLYMSVCVTKC